MNDSQVSILLCFVVIIILSIWNLILGIQKNYLLKYKREREKK